MELGDLCFLLQPEFVTAFYKRMVEFATEMNNRDMLICAERNDFKQLDNARIGAVYDRLADRDLGKRDVVVHFIKVSIPLH